MFKNAKVGDRVWNFIRGWGTIIDTSWDEDYPIFVKFDYEEFKICFTYEGFADADDKNPTLFWDEIKFEIPEKPFSLENKLRKLEIKSFISNRENFYLEWDNYTKKIHCEQRYYNQQPFGICFEKESVNDFMDNIKDKEITKEEFFTAYKNVFGKVK